MSATMGDDMDAGSMMSAAYSTAASTTSGTKKRTRRKKPVEAKPLEPQKPAFTIDLIPKSLSQLGKTADGLRPAYLRLDISGTDMRTTEEISNYRDLQTLVLPGNDLADLSHLSRLQSLTHLDVSGNKLAQVLDFKPETGSSNLRYADFSSNLIATIAPIVHFSRLEHLNLERNQLRVLRGLDKLPMLRVLKLANNSLRSCEGLGALSGLRELDLSNNALGSLQDLAPLKGLEVLNVSHNLVSSLAGMEGLTSLRWLDLTHNCLAGLVELGAVTGAALLGTLAVTEGNLLGRVMQCRLHLVHLLPQAAVLDGQDVTPKEKVLAANMHGADADGLRAIRRRFFPDGELDDGGGAIPPPSAGLVASAAEEEIGDAAAVASAFVRIDAWARSTKVAADKLGPGAAAPGAALLALASQLASVCSGQLQLARACYQWVASHAADPSKVPLATRSVEAPLIAEASGGAAAEEALLGPVTGMWCERAAWLFVQLARACELEAVLIPGFWKGAWDIAPGESVAAHNHCWAAVKVSGRWRLVDPAAAAVHGAHAVGESPAAPFFVPPDAWAYSYHPLEAWWQLLPEPISLSDWWAMPQLSVGFFARGMQLLEPAGLASVNMLPAPREGEPLPSLELKLAAPLAENARIRHVLRDAATGQDLAAWPPTASGTTTTGDARGDEPGELAWWQGARAFQQVEVATLPGSATGPGPGSSSNGSSSGSAGRSTAVQVHFGGKSYVSVPHRLMSALPGPGTYLLEVQYVTDIPGGLPVRLDGLHAPLVFRLVETEVVLRAKIIVPDVEPHDPEDGVLHSDATPARPMPATHPEFVHLRAALLSPSASEPLEADREYHFHVVVPGASRIAMAMPDGRVLGELVPLSRPPTRDDPNAGSLPGVGISCESSAAGLAMLPVTTPPPGTPPGPGGPAAAPSPAPPSQAAPSPELRRPGSGRPGSAASALQQGQQSHFASVLRAPRAPYVQILAYKHMSALGVCGWVPLLTLPVAQQSQHIVYQYMEEDVPEIDPGVPEALHAADLFKNMDLDADGRVRRREALVAIKHNRQVADILKLPHIVRADDGTLDKFTEGFLNIDTSKLGSFTFNEMCAYMGIKPRDPGASDEEEGDEEDGEWEDGTYEESPGTSRPVSPGMGEA